MKPETSVPLVLSDYDIRLTKGFSPKTLKNTWLTAQH